MLKMKHTTTITAVLSTCCFNGEFCAYALQASSLIPRTARGSNTAHRYLDEGHPLSYDRADFGVGSTTDLSDELRAVRASIEVNVRGGIETGVPRGTGVLEVVTGRRGKASPKGRGARRGGRAARARAPSSDLLTFDEEKEIAGAIRRFRSVTRARDDLLQASDGAGGPSERRWASTCSLSVDQLRDAIARGQEARTRLVRGNVGLVTAVARRYHAMLGGGAGPSAAGGAGGTSATLKLDDLVQEGYMGIMEAAERFDPTRGFRFSTYATHWIRQRIVHSIGESSRMIRLPVHVQTTMRNMHKKNKELEARIGRQPSLPELADETGVPLDKIHLYQHLTRNVLSLELPVDRHANSEDKRTIGDRVACTEMATPDEDFMSESMKKEVHAMLDALGHDERSVLNQRFGLEDGRPKSRREIAEGMGMSSDVVRTMEVKALQKLRQPQIHYRLKDYVGESAMFGVESDYAERHPCGTRHDVMASAGAAAYHYPHHTNVESLYANSNVRATPESVWSI